MLEIACKPCSNLKQETTLEIPEGCVECKHLLIEDCDALCTNDDEIEPVSEVEDCELWSED